MDKEISDLAKQFVLARITNVRGVDLTIFDFDYDLTWMAFFMNADQHVYSRFGGRDHENAEKALSLKGLKYSMRKALVAYKSDPKAKAERLKKPFRNVEDYPAARRVKKGTCIHCHQVHDFDREWRIQKKTWSKERIWVYPPPENVGLVLHPDQGDLVKAVLPKSPAAKAGIRANDVLQTVGDHTVNSYGDVQYQLNRAPQHGKLAVTWKRGDQIMSGHLSLPSGWRKSDISWRGSMWGLEPQAHVYGKNLTVEEKKKLGLSPKRLAFYQGNYVPPRSRQAGIRARDVIIGVDGKKLEMTMLQFNVWVRLNFKDGDRIVFNVIRRSKRMSFPMTLQARSSK